MAFEACYCIFPDSHCLQLPGSTIEEERAQSGIAYAELGETV
jgi:hypothetical protein